MEKILISIIVPIYNIDKYLYDCLNSLRIQNSQSVEFILVDDGSTDRSNKICQEFLYDKRFKYYYKENGGLSSARNFGIKYSKGDYIWFVDGDDFIADDALNKIIQTISENNTDIIQFGYYIGIESTSPKRMMHTFGLKTQDEIIKEYLFYGPEVACNKVYKTKIFNDISFKEGIINEDSYIISEILRKIDSWYNLEDCLYYYRQREGSIMRTKFSEKNLDIILSCDHLIDIFSDNLVYKKVSAARSAVTMANYYYQYLADKNCSYVNLNKYIYKFYEYYKIYKSVKTTVKLKQSWYFQIYIFNLNPRLYCLLKNIL